MQPWLGVLLLVLPACTVSTITEGIDGTDGIDGAPGSPIDLAGAEVLCTSAACAATPCTAGCVFTLPTARGCATGQAPVARAQAAACPGYCGFSQYSASPYGCRRFKSEDTCCTSDCHCYGSWDCYPPQSDIEYRDAAQICDGDHFCMSGEPPGDFAPAGQCLDSGVWGFSG